MGYTCERLGTFGALIAFLASASLAITSIFTSSWFESSVLNGHGLAKESYVHAGLFWGERSLDWGLGQRHQPFSVVHEVRSGYSFMQRPLWAFVLFFGGLGLLWVAVGAVTALFAAVGRPRQNIAGPIGIYLWSLLALISFGACCIIYFIQFTATIKHNVLLQNHLDAGFTTEGQARLGYSFYLMLAAAAVLYFPPSFIFFSQQRREKLNPRKEYRGFDPNILMY